MSNKHEPSQTENWQFALGGWGLIAWSSLTCNLQTVQEWHSFDLRTFTVGYLFGFVATFGGNVCLSLLTRRGRERLKPTGVGGWLAITIICMVLCGAWVLAYWMQLSISEPVPFMLGLSTGSFVVNQGVMNFLLELERWRKRPGRAASA